MLKNLPIISQLTILFGLLMRGLYIFSLQIGIENIIFGLALFVIISKILLLPNSYNAQKLTLLSAPLNEPATKVNEKYTKKLEHPLAKNKFNVDKCYLFGKYNLKPSNGCTTTLLQLPVVIALYSIIQDMPQYVPELNAFSEDKLNSVLSIFGYSLHETPGFRFDLIMLFPLSVILFQFFEGLLTKKFQGQNIASNNQKETNEQAKMMKNTMKLTNLFAYGSTLYFACSLPLVCSVYWAMRTICDIITKILFYIYIRFKKIDFFEQQTLKKLNKNRKKRDLPPLMAIQ